MGDIVLTHKGNWKSVISTQKMLTNKLIEITTNTGKMVSCTPDHMWLVQFPSSGNKKPRDFICRKGFVRADELEVYDTIPTVKVKRKEFIKYGQKENKKSSSCRKFCSNSIIKRR